MKKKSISPNYTGFFSKFLMGELKIFGPRRSLTGRKSDGGGTCEKNPTEAKTAHLCKVRPFFAILSMKYSF